MAETTHSCPRCSMRCRCRYRGGCAHSCKRTGLNAPTKKRRRVTAKQKEKAVELFLALADSLGKRRRPSTDRAVGDRA